MIKNVFSISQTGFVPKYIPVISSLRGFASVVVCVFHLICLPLNFLENTLVFRLAPYGKFGVQIFFVITGVVITLSLLNGKYNYKLFGKFMRKRILRIEPPYLFSILAAVLLIAVKNRFLPGNHHQIPSAENLLLHIGYLIPFVKGQHWFIIVFWTMAVEFQFYLLVSLIFPLLTNPRLPLRLFVYLLIFGSAAIFTNQQYTLVWLPVFMMGISYINFRCSKIKKPELALLLVLAAGFSFFLLGVPVTIVAITTLAIIHFFSDYQNRIGNFFGRISYSLYLTHTIFGSATENFFAPHVSQLYAKLLVVFFSFIVSIVAACIFYELIEKPSRTYASKISLKNNIKAAVPA